MKYAIRFLCVIMAAVLLGEISYTFFRNKYRKDWIRTEAVSSLGPRTESVPRVMAGMELTIEDYDEDSETVISERNFFCSNLIGLDWAGTEKLISDPYFLGDQDAFARGYYCTKLMLLDRKQLRLRRLFSAANTEYRFIGLLWKRELYMFDAADKSVVSHETTERGALPFDLIRRLETGVYVKGIEHLRELCFANEAQIKIGKEC